MTTARNVAMGLAYLVNFNDAEVSAEHEVIYAGAEGVGVDDQVMPQFGWSWDSHYECWMIYV